MRVILAIFTLIASTSANAFAQDDVADIVSEDLRAGKDEQKRYFLIGPKKNEKAPKNGFGLVVVLPGGTATAEFHPFIKRIYKESIPDGYLAAQLVSIKWTDKPVIVWPTATNPVEKMKFTTEDFVAAVIEDVKSRQKVNDKKILTFGGLRRFGHQQVRIRFARRHVGLQPQVPAAVGEGQGALLFPVPLTGRSHLSVPHGPGRRASTVQTRREGATRYLRGGSWLEGGLLRTPSDRVQGAGRSAPE
jgi:hypothetical protein